MTDLTKSQFSPRTRAKESAWIPLRLTAIVAGLLLMALPFLPGCGEGEQTGSEPSAAPVGATTSVTWDPIQDPSVSDYFVHYGRQSPGHPGSCAYESSMQVVFPPATVTNLDPNTLYYFTIRAYNGRESACSREVSFVTKG
jgi:hypothetical protein